MAFEQKLWKDRIRRSDGSIKDEGTPYSAGNMNRIEQGVADAHAALEGANRQVQTIGQGVSVLNAAVNTPVDIEVEGRTLTSLGNSKLDSTKYHVLSAKRTKVKMESGNVYQGPAKIYAETGVPQITRIANFEDKVSGSTLENPHSLKYTAQTTLQSPTGSWTDSTQIHLDRVKTLGDSPVHAVSTPVSGNYGQQLFSFNLIEEVERHIGTIPRADVAGKVQWLKDNITKLTANWHGYGSGPTGNNASVSVWNNSTSAWTWGTNTTSSTVSKVVHNHVNTTALISACIDVNGLIHYLAYAGASDGTTASTINTDYIELEIELKAGADFREPSIPLYEVTAENYAKILVEWNEEEVRRRYPAVKGTQHINGLAIIAEGDNLIPPFTEWSNISVNATIKGHYELETISPDTSNRVTSTILPVITGQTYTLSTKGTARVLVYKTNASGAHVVTAAGNGAALTFTVDSSFGGFIYVRTDNGLTAGTFTTSQPMLTLGSTAKPFVPRNPSMLIAPTKLGSIGTAKDLLFKQDGVWKRRKVVEKDVVLDGSLAWAGSTDYTGFKRFPVPGLSTTNSVSKVTKHNGSVLKDSTATDGADQQYFSGSGTLNITVSDIDSGLGETYVPVTDEIKAYFNGWKASTVDGAGKPTAWVSLVDGSAAPTQTLAYVSANKAANYTPYKLSYVLATPVVETVNVEGDIVANGLTQVEVTAGAIVREKVMPQKHATSGFWYINEKGLTTSAADSPLSKRTNSIIAVYKNGQIDPLWTMYTNATNQNGNVYLYAEDNKVDTTAEYTVTYLAFDRQLLTVNPLDVDTSFAQNVRSAVEDINAKAGDTATSVSIHATLLYEILKRLKAGGL